MGQDFRWHLLLLDFCSLHRSGNASHSFRR